MNITPLGLTFPSAKPVLEPVSAADFFAAHTRIFDNITTPTLGRIRHLDGADDHYANTETAGWRIIANTAVDRNLITELEPDIVALGKKRNGRDMSIKDILLDYPRDNPAADNHDTWSMWIRNNYEILDTPDHKAPFYLLIIGPPASVPFGLQLRLCTMAAVGRICFDTSDQYRDYLTKLRQKPATTTRNVVVFAPNHDGPTSYSARFMARPLLDEINSHTKASSGTPSKTVDLIDTPDTWRATKAGLHGAVSDFQPAMVYAAGHGLRSESPSTPCVTGALYCPAHAETHIPIPAQDYFSAHDLDHRRPFVESGIFFQFGCFGYGMPAASTIAHLAPGVAGWKPAPESVCLLPRELLSMPRGPLAYVGHLDAALLLGFYDEQSHLDAANNRLKPFAWLVNWLLLKGYPVGYAFGGFRRSMASVLNTTFDMVNESMRQPDNGQDTGNGMTMEQQQEVVFEMLRIIDARNFMIFGDPAVGLPL